MGLFEHFPYTNLHDLNLDWAIDRLKELFARGESLYAELQSWKTATDADLESWKSTTMAGIQAWETQLLAAINTWESGMTAEWAAWKTQTQADLTTQLGQMEAQITAWEQTAQTAWTATQAAAEAAATAAAGSATAAAGSASQASTIADYANASLMFTNHTIIDPAFGQGGINPDGSSQSSDNRIRSSWIGYPTDVDRVFWYKSNPEGYYFRLWLYDTETETYNFIQDWTTDSMYLIIPAGSLLRICVKKGEDGSTRFNVSDYTAAGYEIQMARPLANVTQKAVYFAQGSISTTNGTNYGTASNRVRLTQQYDTANTIISMTEHVQIGYRWYNAEGAYQGFTEQYHADIEHVPTTYPKFRAVFYMDDDSALDPEFVLNNVQIWTSGADTTLEIPGAYPDSFTVGAEIRKINLKLNRSIKILGIGNSHTESTFKYLNSVLHGMGFDDVLMVQGYWGGSSLQGQYESLPADSANHTVYTYQRYENSNTPVERANWALSDLIPLEAYDFISLQQQSDDAGWWPAFVNEDFDISDFMDYIQANAQPGYKLGYIDLWSRKAGYTGATFLERYGTQAAQVTADSQVAAQLGMYIPTMSCIITANAAIQMARGNTNIASVYNNDLIKSDNTHLQAGIPQYIASLIYAGCVTGISPLKCTWSPYSIVSSATEYLSYLAKQIADTCLDSIPGTL